MRIYHSAGGIDSLTKETGKPLPEEIVPECAVLYTFWDVYRNVTGLVKRMNRHYARLYK